MDEHSCVVAFTVVEIPAAGGQLCLCEGRGHIEMELFPLPVSPAMAVLLPAVTNAPGCLSDTFGFEPRLCRSHFLCSGLPALAHQVIC